jgi:hypothetical protein
MLKALEKVLKTLGILANNPEHFVWGNNTDLEKQADKLRDFINKKNAAGKAVYGYHERAAAQQILAGLYNRRGYTAWARMILEELEKEAGKTYANPIEDPLYAETDINNSPADRGKETQMRRDSVLWVTQGDLAHLEREKVLLLEAAAYLKIALTEMDTSETLPADIASQVYLTGEFSRRGEDYARGWLYLAAAVQMDKVSKAPADKKGLEIAAADQFEELKIYMNAAGVPAPDFAKGDAVPKEEIAMVGRLVKRFSQMQKEEK